MLSLELLRRGYNVAIGKINNREVDFIATKVDDKIHRIEWKSRHLPEMAYNQHRRDHQCKKTNF